MYKICLNLSEVLLVFDKEDLVKDFWDFDFSYDDFLLKWSLGVCWDFFIDSFIFCVYVEEKFYIRRGVFFVVNGLYDFLGFVMFVIIGGKLLLCEVMVELVEWD